LNLNVEDSTRSVQNISLSSFLSFIQNKLKIIYQE